MSDELDFGVFSWPREPHYNASTIEAIEVMESACNPWDVCKSNVLKYALRAGSKGDRRAAISDLIKCGRYLARMIILLQRTPDDELAQLIRARGRDER